MRTYSLLLVLALTVAVFAQTFPIFQRRNIDDFTLPNSGPTHRAAANGEMRISSSAYVGDARNILGGERDLVVRVISINSTNPDIQASSSVYDGEYSYSVDSAIDSVSQIQWDGVDGGDANFNKVGLGGVDLTIGGTQDAFRFRLISSDQPATTTLEVWDMAGRAFNQTFTSTTTDVVDELIIIWRFSDFVNIDFTRIGAIRMITEDQLMNSRAALDIRYGALTTTQLLPLLKRDVLAGPVVTNSTFTYSFLVPEFVANRINSPSLNAIFTDILPAGLSYVPGSLVVTNATNVVPIINGQNITITFTSIIRVDTTSQDITEFRATGLSFQVRVDALPCTRTQFVNQATIRTANFQSPSSDWDGSVASINLDAPTVTPVTGASALTVAFTNVSPTTVVAGSTVVYNYRVCNVGNREATGVSVSFALPAGTTIVGTDYSCTAAGVCTRVIANSLYNVNGGCVVDSFQLRYTAGSCRPTPVVVQIAATQTCVPVVAAVTATSPSVQPSGDVRVSLTSSLSSSNLNVGTQNCVVATYTYTNQGSSAADQGASLSVSYNGQFVSAVNTTVCSAGTCTINLGTLAAGSTGSRSLTFCPLATASCNDANTVLRAVLTESCVPSSVNVSNTLNIVAPVALSIVKTRSASGIVNAGGVMNFNLRITNTGVRTATGLVVTDNRPAFTTLEQVSSVGWSCNAAGVCTKTSVASLAPGAFVDETISFRVNNPLACGTNTTVNSASVAESCQAIVANSNSVAVPLNTSVSFTFSSSIPSSIDLDDNVLNCFDAVYSYANTGTSNSDSASFTVQYNTQYLSTVNNNCSAGSCSFALGALAAGSSGSRTIRFCHVDTVSCQDVSSVITARFTESCGPIVIPTTNTLNIIATTVLSLSKSRRGSGAVAPGSLVTFDLTTSNTGSRGTTGLVLTDTRPANFVLDTSSASDGWSCNAAGDCTRAVSSLAARNNGTTSISFRVVSPLQCTDTQTTNVARVTGTCQNRTAVSNTVVVPFVANPTLNIIKEDDLDEVSPGVTFNYTITYSNTGNRVANNVVIVDTYDVNEVPAAVQSVVGINCDTVARTCTIPIGTLSPTDGVRSFKIAFTVRSTIPLGVNSLSNTVTISSPAPCASNATEGEDTILLTNPDVYIFKTRQQQFVAAGNNVVFTLAYGNRGDTPAAMVQIVDVVPSNSQFAIIDNSGWSCTGTESSAGVYTAESSCTRMIGTLEAGATGSVVVTYRTPATLQCVAVNVDNTATITTISADTNTTNNVARATSTLTAPVVLVVTKTANVQRAEAGSMIVYTITYTNTGSRVATNVALTEKYGLYVTPMDSNWTCAAVTRECLYTSGILASLAPGASRTVTFTVRVDAFLPTEAIATVNEATVMETCQNATDSDSVSVQVFGVPDLKLCKSGRIEQLTYELCWSNCGSAGTTGVVLTESVPAMTTFNAEDSDSRWVCENIQGNDDNELQQCTLTIGSLDAATAGCADFVVDVMPSADECTTFDNRAALMHDLVFSEENTFDNSDEGPTLGGCNPVYGAVGGGNVEVNCPQVTCNCPDCVLPSTLTCSSATCDATTCANLENKRSAVSASIAPVVAPKSTRNSLIRTARRFGK